MNQVEEFLLSNTGSGRGTFNNFAAHASYINSIAATLEQRLAEGYAAPEVIAFDLQAFEWEAEALIESIRPARKLAWDVIDGNGGYGKSAEYKARHDG